MTDTKKHKRILNLAGYVHLTPGWVSALDAATLQAQIDEAVKRAADEVNRIKGADHG